MLTASQFDTLDISLFIVRVTGVSGGVASQKRLTLPNKVVSSAKPRMSKSVVELLMSFMYIMNRRGPRIEP